MRQSLKAGLLSCAIFLGLVGLLFGYQAIYPAVSDDPTESTPSINAPVTTDPTDPSPSDPVVSLIPDPPTFSLYSSHVFVYDTASNQLLFCVGEMDTQLAPASLTKLFTAYAALQCLDPSTIITVTDEVSLIDPNSSIAYIYSGYRLSVEQCIEGMLLPSGNDASYVLAAAAGRALQNNPTLSTRTAISVFMNYVNELAERLGLENTHFINPDGIDATGHYTSMEDLLAIGQLALETPILRKYCALAKDTVTLASGQTRTWENSNEILHSSSNYYRPNACGLKTGSTSRAGNCLISAFAIDGGHLIIGVLGSASKNGRYEDTVALYDYYLAHLSQQD